MVIPNRKESPMKYTTLLCSILLALIFGSVGCDEGAPDCWQGEGGDNLCNEAWDEWRRERFCARNPASC
jgi:hypothetical protein